MNGTMYNHMLVLFHGVSSYTTPGHSLDSTFENNHHATPSTVSIIHQVLYK